MASFSVRAVKQTDGRYRIAIEPREPDVDVQRTYSADEVRLLAHDIRADLRLVSAPEATRSADQWGGTLPAGDED